MLRASFSSRFIIVEAGQSLGAGAATETSGAPLFDALDVTLAVTLLKVAPAAIVELFFFTISRCIWEYERRLKNGGGAVAMRKKNEEGREAVKEKNEGSKLFSFSFIKGELPRDL
jgi:hypothetical protein